MAKQGSSASGVKTPAPRSDHNASGGLSRDRDCRFPQKLYTRTFGDPDTLFVQVEEERANKGMCPEEKQL
jgi:hypothetical protein